MIKITGLYKTFNKVQVLNGLNLTVREGETKAVIGRSGAGKSVLLKCIMGLLVPDGGSIKVGGQEVVLQPREFRLLEYLMKHAGQVVTRTMLLENVWDYHFDPQTNVIDVHISRLRSKIDKGFTQPLLHTVRGAGYMIRDGAR